MSKFEIYIRIYIVYMFTIQHAVLHECSELDWVCHVLVNMFIYVGTIVSFFSFPDLFFIFLYFHCCSFC